MIRRFIALVVLLLAAGSASGVASARVASRETYPYLVEEITAGWRMRAEFVSAHGLVESGPEWEAGQIAFLRLVRTAGARSGPSLPYTLTIYGGSEINAFSSLGGQVFVPVGMARLLGTSEGLWAAVLSHEIGHCYERHSFRGLVKAYQQAQAAENLRRQAAAGNSSAQVALAVMNVAGTLIERKIDRNEEHEADKIGISLMVQAGYHPNWAVSMYRALKARFGDKSKFGAFFSDHPRWETREERAAKMFDDAIAEFDLRWPELARSPGGMPPPVAFLRKPRAAMDKDRKTVTITAEYEISDPQRSEVGAVVFFFEDKKFVQGALDEYRDKTGALFTAEDVPRSRGFERGTVTLALPAAALGAKDRKVDGVLMLVTAEEVLDVSDRFKVEFPKP